MFMRFCYFKMPNIKQIKKSYLFNVQNFNFKISNLFKQTLLNKHKFQISKNRNIKCAFAHCMCCFKIHCLSNFKHKKTKYKNDSVSCLQNFKITENKENTCAVCFQL